jgi:predicted GNAT family N-acyltransferase
MATDQPRYRPVIFGICRSSDNQLVAFARVLTDRVFKAWVFDVILSPGCRREGLGRAIMERLLGHPNLAGLRHIELYCLLELVPFYEQWGFSTDVSGVKFLRARSLNTEQ